jgi:hypothetical protein
MVKANSVFVRKPQTLSQASGLLVKKFSLE